VFIVAPTTEGERLDRNMEHVSGYVYVQARTGVTGAKDDVSDQTERSLDRLADYDVPKAVGFGIKTGEHAERIVAGGADGVIVGSALVDIVAEGTSAASQTQSDDVAEGVANDTPTEEVAARLEEKARELKAGAERGYEQRVPQAEGN
jgi:tryptophan synthase alpha chain